MFQVLLTGLSIGAIYGFVAMGFAVVYYVTRVINFATGQLLMCSIMVTAGLVTIHWGLGLAIAAGLLLSAVLGVVIYFLTVRPVLRFSRSSFSWLVSTLGVAIILESGAALIWGTSSLGFPQMLNGNDVKILDAELTWQQITTILAAIAVTVLFELFRTRTLVGKLGMAISADPDTAASMGVNVAAYTVAAFALGGLLAGVAGVLVGPISFANPYLGDTYGIYGFVALMMGGIERPAASMGGGLLLGVLTTIASTYINPQATNWFPFVIVLVVLLVTPTGVFVRGRELLGVLAARRRAAAS